MFAANKKPTSGRAIPQRTRFASRESPLPICEARTGVRRQRSWRIAPAIPLGLPTTYYLTIF